MADEIDPMAECIRGLGSVPNASALPDPNWLWVRAQLAAREDAAARALRMWTLRQTLGYGLLSAGAVGWFLSWMKTAGAGLDPWVQTLAAPFVGTVGDIAISALAALAVASVTVGLVLGGPLIVRRLRYVGLL